MELKIEVLRNTTEFECNDKTKELIFFLGFLSYNLFRIHLCFI